MLWVLPHRPSGRYNLIDVNHIALFQMFCEIVALKTQMIAQFFLYKLNTYSYVLKGYNRPILYNIKIWLKVVTSKSCNGCYTVDCNLFVILFKLHNVWKTIWTLMGPGRNKITVPCGQSPLNRSCKLAYSGMGFGNIKREKLTWQMKRRSYEHNDQVCSQFYGKPLG